MTMMEPKIDELLDQVDSKYTLVIMSAKRARSCWNSRSISSPGYPIECFPVAPTPRCFSDSVRSIHLKE